MQQKRGSSRLRIFLALLAIFVVAGALALTLADVPVPQKPIEVQLDAKAFLDSQKQ